MTKSRAAASLVLMVTGTLLLAIGMYLIAGAGAASIAVGAIALILGVLLGL